jgi:hypothetical protein
MNHPKPEEWLCYLEGETSPEARQRLGKHLECCPECAAELEGWRRSVEKLERWSFPPRSQLRASGQAESAWAGPLVKWGLAAALALFLGFAAGRLSSPGVGPWKKAIAAEVREELRQEMRADLLAAFGPEQGAGQGFQRQLRLDVEAAVARAAKSATENPRLLQEVVQTVQQQREEDQRRLVAFIRRVRDQQAADYLALRQDLETAVSAADSDLRQNSRRISQLADTLLTAQK